jgi:ABC-type multidrug transport system fused ATPase/permease subunit
MKARALVQKKSMFRLKISPDFSRQKKLFLSESKIPDIELPKCVEDCLESISEVSSDRGDRYFLAGGVGGLWLQAIRPIKTLLVRATLVSALAALGAALSTLAAMRFLSAGESMKTLLALGIVYASMNCLSHFATFQGSRLRTWAGLSVESTLVGLISQKILRLSSFSAAEQSSGNLKILITSDVKNVGQFVDNAVRNLIPAVVAVSIIAPLLVHFSGRAGLCGVLVLVMVLPVSLGLNRIATRFKEKSQAEMDALTSLAGEWVKNIRLIRYLSWDEAFRREVASCLRKFMSVSSAQHVMACLIFGLSISWWMVSTTGVVLASHFFHFPLDLVGFFGSLWLLSYLSGYFTHLPNTIRYYGEASPSIRRISVFLAEPEQRGHLHEGKALPPGSVPSKLAFKRVDFEYPQGGKVIHELSVEIDLGKKIAVIGEFGSGKTTFLKLVCGELPPTKGKISVHFENGEIRDLWSTEAHEIFRRFIAFVPQEPFVSSDLLLNNITLGEGSSEQAMESAYWAELEADIQALPHGIFQEIGESGVNLSGGQRQRLNLARAHFSGRGYLVLDDTLSAVDTKTETLLMERLEDKNSGFVLVSHRTRELTRVAEVMVMKDGAIIERGHPLTLMADPHSHFTRVLKAYEEVV